MEITLNAYVLIQAFFNAMYRALSQDLGQDVKLGRLSYDLGTANPLRILVEDLWGRFGQTMRFEHEGQTVDLRLQGPGIMTGTGAQYSATEITPLRQELDAFLEPLFIYGTPAPGFVRYHALSYDDALAQQLGYMLAVRSCPAIFSHQDREVQARGAEILQRYLAGMLTVISLSSECNRLEREMMEREKPMPEERARREGINLKVAQGIALMEQELPPLFEMYMMYHCEGRALPGDNDLPILRFLPAPLRQRLRIMGGGNQQEEGPPPARGEGVHAGGAAEDRPVLTEADVHPAVGGLRRIRAGAEVLKHPRLQYYITTHGAKAVYATTFLSTDEFHALPLWGANGNIIIVLVSLQDQHAADHFFLAGKPGDPTDVLLRWTVPAQWNRLRLIMADPQPATYLGRVCNQTQEAHDRGVRYIIANN